MPFDISIPAHGSVDTSKMTPRERLEMLRDFLRTPTPNAYWDYENVFVRPERGKAGCALGWYIHLTGDSFLGTHLSFDLTPAEDDRLFVSAGKARGIDMSEVTPSMVADDIDKYLRGELDV